MKSAKYIIALALVMSTMQLFAYERDTTDVFPIVSGGLKLQANTSNFLMKNIPAMPNLGSKMNVGGELGAFIDFNITRHFFIQFNLLGTAEQCIITNSGKQNRMWTVGLEIPVYLLARFGNHQKGYVYFGGGPYTEFSLWGQMKGDDPTENPYKHTFTDTTGDPAYVMADNHSGLAAYRGYEFPFGLQINASYQAALTDILTFEHDRHTFVRPEKITLGVGYRF